MEETTFMADPMRLMIATLAAMYFLGIRRGFTGAQLKKILDHSLRPVGMILLVIASGGVIRWMLQDLEILLVRFLKKADFH